MGSQNLQMSEWSTAQTSPSKRENLSKKGNENKIRPVDDNQHSSNNQTNRRYDESVMG